MRDQEMSRTHANGERADRASGTIWTVTEQSPQARKINWPVFWAIAGVAVGAVGVVVAILAWLDPRSPATSNGSAPVSELADEASTAITQGETSTQSVTNTTIATTTTKSKHWVERYKEAPLHLQDSVVIDFDADPLPIVKTEDFPGGDLKFSFTGRTWSDEPVVLSVHDGPNGSRESCETSLQLGPTTSTYISDDTPFMCVRTGEGAIGFITVLETITDYRINVTLWALV